MAESIDAKYSYGGLINIEFDYKKIEDKEQPVMIFHGKSDNAFQIPLDCAHKYTDDTALVRTAAVIAQLLNLGNDRNTVFKIAGLIENHLEELVRMPPTPNGERLEAEEKEPKFYLNGQEIIV